MTETPKPETIISILKLRDYILSEQHEKGRHKARIFRASLGIGGRQAEALREALLTGFESYSGPPLKIMETEHGKMTTYEFPITIGARTALIRSLWITPAGSASLKLVSCYPMRTRR